MSNADAGSTPKAQTAVKAAAFVDTLGVNAHLSYNDTAYANIEMVKASINYLGINNVRDIVTPWSQDNMTLLAKEGVKFDLVIGSNLALDYQKQAIASMGYALRFVEGPNEVDFWPVKFGDLTGNLAAKAMMRNLHDWVNSGDVVDSTGAKPHLLQLTFGKGESWSQFGSLAGLADYGNIHGYVAYGASAGSAVQQHIKSADLVSGKGVPIVATEAGFNTGIGAPESRGVTEEVQAKNTLNLLFEHFNAGVAVTYLYELLDMNTNADGANGENHFGLFHTDGSPKLAATAIHNVTTILGGQFAGAPGSLTYALQGMPSSADSLLMQKNANDFVLAVWDDADNWDEANAKPIYHEATSVHMDLSNWSGLVKIYDPTVSGTTPIKTFYSTGDFSIDVQDHVTLVELDASQTGSNDNEVIRAQANGAAVLGMGGADQIYSGNGNDYLDGGAGDDTIRGGDGDSTLIGGAGDDTIVGGKGSELFIGGEGNDTLSASAGNDTISYKSTTKGVQVDLNVKDGSAVGTEIGQDVLARFENAFGGSGDDTLVGNQSNNLLVGGAGNDSLNGLQGNDVLTGGAGRDVFVFDVSWEKSRITDFTAGEDKIQFRDNVFSTAAAALEAAHQVGSDVIIDAGTRQLTLQNVSLDELTPGSFAVMSQIVKGTNRSDILDGTHASDTVYGLKSGDIIAGGDGEDYLNGGGGNDKIYGGDGDSTLVGGNGNDTIFGGQGSETFIAGKGKDVYDGGDGNDTISFANIKNGVQVDLDLVKGFATGADLSKDVVKWFENVIGGVGNDSITGNVLDNVFAGGGGSDTFNFNGSFGSDTITDFTAGADHIAFGNGLFASFDAVAAASHQDGNNLVIDSAEGQITVANVSIEQMRDAFIF